MKISIIIVSYNTCALLRNCLTSVREKAHGVGYEVFVVDNASSDGSYEMVEKEFPEVNLIQNRENRGFSRANNQAIKESRGDYVLLLNSDTVLDNNAVGIMYEFMQAHPRAAVCGPLLLNADRSVQRSIDTHLTVRSLLWKKVVSGTPFIARNKYHPDRFHYSTRCQVQDGWLTGACLMIRQTVFNQVGLLDERYHFAMEDADWGLAVSRWGWETWFVPEAVVSHYRGASGQSWLGTEMEIHGKVRGLRQSVAFVKKNYGVFPCMGYRAAMIVMLTGNLIIRSLSPIRYVQRRRQEALFKRRLAWTMLLAAFGRGDEETAAQTPMGSETPSSARDLSRAGRMSEKYRLAIVMHRATQFDGPLFAKLFRSERLELKVYYTAPGEKAVSDIDAELGIRPQWGEMATAGYEHEARAAGMLGLIRFLRKIVDAGHPNLIIVSGYMPLLHVLVAIYAWFRRVPVGLRSDTTLQHSKTARVSLKGLLKRFILQVLFKVYSTAHPVGTFAEEYLLHYGVSKKRMFPFPYAVNNGWFRAKSSAYHVSRMELRREMGIAENAFVVLGILKFHEREDPVTLVLGFAELQAKRHDSSHLLLVGDGPLRGEIETVIHDKSIAHVTLPGYAPYGDLPKYYAVADVFVHPGAGESWGVSVNESMACGVPVVLSDRVGSHVDLVREGETGFVFKVKDSKSLAQCLATMAGDRRFCETMGNKARLLIEDWGYDATERSILRALRYVSARPG